MITHRNCNVKPFLQKNSYILKIFAKSIAKPKKIVYDGVEVLKMKVENTDITSQRLKESRETRRMTLQELSDLTGFSTSVLSRYENGHIEKLSCERLAIIAKALNISPVWLMGFDEETSELAESKYMLDPVEREIVDTYRKADARQKMRIGGLISEIADEIEKNHSGTNGNGKVG